MNTVVSQLVVLIYFIISRLSSEDILVQKASVRDSLDAWSMLEEKFDISNNFVTFLLNKYNVGSDVVEMIREKSVGIGVYDSDAYKYGKYFDKDVVHLYTSEGRFKSVNKLSDEVSLGISLVLFTLVETGFSINYCDGDVEK
jgi:hypothetical protein